MATADIARQRLISTLASLSRHHPDDPRLPELRAELVTVSLAARITKTLKSTPLTAAQRERLALLLHSGAGNG